MHHAFHQIILLLTVFRVLMARPCLILAFLIYAIIYHAIFDVTYGLPLTNHHFFRLKNYNKSTFIQEQIKLNR